MVFGFFVSALAVKLVFQERLVFMNMNNTPCYIGVIDVPVKFVFSNWRTNSCRETTVEDMSCLAGKLER